MDNLPFTRSDVVVGIKTFIDITRESALEISLDDCSCLLDLLETLQIAPKYPYAIATKEEAPGV